MSTKCQKALRKLRNIPSSSRKKEAIPDELRNKERLVLYSHTALSSHPFWWWCDESKQRSASLRTDDRRSQHSLQRTQATVFLIVVLFDSIYPSSQNGLMACMQIRAGLPANKSRRRDAGCNQLLVSCRSKWPVLALLQIIQQALAQKSGHLPQW